MNFAGAYSGRRVLVTGHTGFKGSWLSLWLHRLGAVVTGLALPPDTEPSHWALLRPPVDSHELDLRDAAAVRSLVSNCKPEIVFHLAAQPLVRSSYDDPLGTWSTNVMGTAHLLDAVRHTRGVRAVVVVTSDKCYENVGQAPGYREDDRLGGHDPYSASKAATELLVSSWRRSFFALSGQTLLASARAGNVIGGGDWAADRLLPDLVRALRAGKPLAVRSPQSTRPWQHVLDPLAGYMLLGQHLLAGDATAATAWNFGPASDAQVSVGTLLDRVQAMWPAARWLVDDGDHPHEARLLHVDSSKAREQLGWRPVWALDDAVAATVDWYRHWSDTGEVRTAQQLDAWTAAASRAYAMGSPA